MAYNETLANRTREMISLTHHHVREIAMFGGLCFMVNKKMCLGVHKDRLMVRIDPNLYDVLIEKEGCKPMDFTGKVMKGIVLVDAGTINTNRELKYWVKLALEYNKFAKASKKKAGKKK